MNVPLAPKFVKGRTEAWCSKGCDVRAAGKESHLYRVTVKKGDIMVCKHSWLTRRLQDGFLSSPISWSQLPAYLSSVL